MHAAQPDSYADLIRKAMREREFSIRDLAKKKPQGTGYSYEHLRKIVAGQPAHSEDCNHELCRLLKLDESAMWTVATREKIRRSYPGENLERLVAPDAQRMKKVWPLLTPEHQVRLAEMAEGLVAQQHLEEPQTKSQILEAIRRLTEKLADADRPAATRKAAAR